MHTVYIYTCKLPSLISGFRSKSMMYGALASGRHIICISSIKHKAKEQANFSQKYSKINPLKKLDFNVTDERILFEHVRHCLGAPLYWGPGQTAPVALPCWRHCLGVSMRLCTYCAVKLNTEGGRDSASQLMCGDSHLLFL